jgi:hypothetical protein
MSSNSIVSGALRKMRVEASNPVSYFLPVGDVQIQMDKKIGDRLILSWSGEIYCVACGRKTNKSFSQGYCFPCFKTLAECDMCIMRPETCHYHLGTCRDTQWADSHCMQPHYVYIANSSGLKVGITRGTQIPTRWIDQGATQAIPVFKVENRLHSGLIEVAMKKHVSDRTDWRKMLKGQAEPLDMVMARDEILEKAGPDLELAKQGNPGLDWQQLNDAPINLVFPVNNYPEKVTSLNFDKTADITGQLQGIKGQYLILDCGVLNIRKFTGYNVSVG